MQLWQTCKMLYLQGRYLALSLTHLIHKSSVCVTAHWSGKESPISGCWQTISKTKTFYRKDWTQSKFRQLLLPRKISAIRPRRKGGVEVEELLTMGPWATPSLWEAVPTSQQQPQCSGDTAWADTVDSPFNQVCCRKTESNYLHSKQANEAWPSAKKGTQLEKQGWADQAAL